jgi:hypothetical protein
MLYNNHFSGSCTTPDCLECIKEERFESYFARQNYAYPENHLDEYSKPRVATLNDIGMFVKSDFPVDKYNAPGEAPYITIKPMSYVGAIEGFNTKQNWIKLTDGNYILNTAKLKFKPAKELTEDEKKAAIVAMAKSLPGMVSTGAQVAITSKDVHDGVKDVTETVLDLTSFLGKNLKWVLILIGIIIAFVFIMNVKKSLSV